MADFLDVLPGKGCGPRGIDFSSGRGPTKAPSQQPIFMFGWYRECPPADLTLLGDTHTEAPNLRSIFVFGRDRESSPAEPALRGDTRADASIQQLISVFGCGRAPSPAEPTLLGSTYKSDTGPCPPWAVSCSS